MKKAVIVYNPAARNAPRFEHLKKASARFSGEWDVSIVSTETLGHGVELAREAATRGADVVFACGGDGTINEVVNGLAGSDASLAVIRGGMGDVFGKEARISRRPEEAMQVLVDGDVRRFDLGRAGERKFLLMAGVGFDARVVRSVPGKAKSWLGSTSYALWGVAALPTYRTSKVLLRLEGEERETMLYWLLLGNTRSYGGVRNITSSALVDDGLLDVYAFEGGGPVWLLSTAVRLASGRQDGGRGVSFYRLRELEVVSPGLPVQLDGEYIGETPMGFGVVPSALKVLLPSASASALFGRQAQPNDLA